MGTLTHRLRATLATAVAAGLYVAGAAHCAHPKAPPVVASTPATDTAGPVTKNSLTNKTSSPEEPPAKAPARVVQHTSLIETDEFLFDQAVKDHVQKISARVERNEHVFAKLGGSSVASLAYLHCFDGKHVDLGQHASLQDTIDYFRKQRIKKRTPFTRQSLATKVGWSLRQGLAGRPPKVLREIRAISPRYALAFFGGNDVQGRNPKLFGERLWHLADELAERGVVPVIGAVFPRGQKEWAPWARRYNQVSRGIAQALSLPYIDFYKGSKKLPLFGLARDGVHPNVYRVKGMPRACNFTEEGLSRGQNLRNLLTLQMLDKLQRRSDGDVQITTKTPKPSIGVSFIHQLPFSEVIESFNGASPECPIAEDEVAQAFELNLSEPVSLRITTMSRKNAKSRVLIKMNGECKTFEDPFRLELAPGEHSFSVAAKNVDEESKVMLVVGKNP